MNPFHKISLIHQITFQVLDDNAKESGYKDWKDMQDKLEIERGQALLIEELIRKAQNKFDSKVGELQK